jgi:hypothetical protein
MRPLRVHDRWYPKFDMERNKIEGKKDKKKAITHYYYYSYAASNNNNRRL